MLDVIKNNHIIKYLPLKLIVLMVSVCLFGNSLFGHGYEEIKNLTIKDGLPSNVVYGVKQDSKGFIWATTNKGVVKYDGRKFQLYTVKDGLPSNDNYAMLLDSRDNIWLYSHKAVSKIGHDGKIKVYEKTNNSYSYFLLNSNDEVFFKRGANLGDHNSKEKHFMIKDENLIELDFSDLGKFNLYTSTVFLDDEGELTVALYAEQNQRKLFRLRDNYKMVEIPTNSHYYKNIFITNKRHGIGEFIYVNDTVSILVNTHFFRIYVCNEPKGEISYAKGMQKASFGNIFKHENDVFLFFDKGIYRFNIDLEKSGYFEPFLELSNVTGIVHDKEGSFWVSTLGEGILKYGQHELDKSNSLFTMKVDNRVFKLSGYKNEKLWYANSKNNIKEMFSNRQYPTKGLIDFRFLLNDGENLFYGGSNAFYINDKLILESGFKDISMSSGSIITASTFGLNFLDKQDPDFDAKGKYGEFKAHIPGRMSSVLLLDKLFYCGNENGLFYGNINKKELIPICLIDDQSTVNISGILKSSDGQIWVATDGFGVFVLKDNVQIKHFSKELLDLNIHSMRIDNRDNIWLSTKLGVNKIEKNGREYFVSNLTSYHGLPSDYVHDTYCYDNILYVATDAGLVNVNLNKINHLEFNKNPPAYIIGAKLIKDGSGKKQDLSRIGSFDYNENNISIEYTGISYRSNGNISFEYRLLPTIPNWTSTSSDNITFNTLASGKYTFEVRAINGIGIKSNIPESYSFTINKHFTQTSWFLLLIGIVLIALSSLIVSTYFRIKRRRDDEINKTQKLISELRLKSLQSQMNPHFIFNSLNAIQQFINVENRRAANDYLARFARLMRLYLGGSENQFIPLEQEMEVIKLYCQLEHLRFADKYEYDIKIQPGLDLSKVHVPAMLLQPHVENAIRHGLVLSDNDNNYLSIDVYESEDGIMCVIKDNGIGRSKSLELKKNNQNRHRSLGNKISKERLEVIRELKLAHIVETIDDVVCNNKVCGTEVRIFIRYQNVK
jgi:Histidine kinase/Y_Y_Y domain